MLCEPAVVDQNYYDQNSRQQMDAHWCPGLQVGLSLG